MRLLLALCYWLLNFQFSKATDIFSVNCRGATTLSSRSPYLISRTSREANIYSPGKVLVIPEQIYSAPPRCVETLCDDYDKVAQLHALYSVSGTKLWQSHIEKPRYILPLLDLHLANS